VARQQSSTWRALLPQSTFWRFIMATAVATLITGTIAMGISMWIGRGLVHDLQEQTGYTVLRNSVDLIGRAQIVLDELRSLYLEDRKETLRSINQYTKSLIDSYQSKVLSGRTDMAQAREAAFDHLNTAIASHENSVFIIDSDYRLVVHPDEAVRNQVVYSFQDTEGDYVFRELVADARSSRPGEVVFILYPWMRGGKQELKLAAAQYYQPWDILICSDMFTGDIETNLADKRLTTLNELRARFREVIIGQSGYVFFFNDHCEMIAHPTLVGEDFGSLPMPDSQTSMCQALQRAAEKPWGENKIHYDWDRPDDKGHFVYPKIAWITREPTTGWYVGVSAYVSEIEAGMPRFIKGIFLPALGSIMLLGAALALLLRNLLKPVQNLAQTCQEVSRGNLLSEAREDATGEIGLLCRQFNSMIRSLRHLRRKEEHRRQELENLNQNLEKIVALRTRALERKAHKLQELNMQLQELDMMKSAFLSSVSHELRTPLTSIRGFAKLIGKDFRKHFLDNAEEDTALRAKAQRIDQNVTIITKEGERLTRLINDVLDLAKIEAGQMDWRETTFSMQEVVEQSLGALASLLAGKPGVSVRVEIPEDLPPLHADRDRLTQLCLNLLDNAVKFTDQGEIVVRTCHREGWLQVRIQDQGSGMDRHDLLRVFDKFHQAGTRDTLQNKPKGTGLGLAICHNIVTHYQGLIWAESEPGRGSEFVFELPVGTGEAKPASARSAEMIPPTPRREHAVSSLDDADELAGMEGMGTTPETPLILVVDDEAPLRSYLRQIFENEGYRVRTAPDGRLALEQARQEPPDLITLDILMPNMDGRETLQRLRNDPTLCNIPVVVISVLPERDHIGGDAALDKPIDEDQLIETVHGLLMHDAGSSRPCLVIKDNGTRADIPIVLFCAGQASYCGPAELMQRVEQGFEGTVIIPSRLTQGLDLEVLAANKRIQIILVPEQRGEHTEGDDG
jgi:signal transduction histidine kinase/CheY-like chemotaxis protein